MSSQSSAKKEGPRSDSRSERILDAVQIANALRTNVETMRDMHMDFPAFDGDFKQGPSSCQQEIMRMGGETEVIKEEPVFEREADLETFNESLTDGVPVLVTSLEEMKPGIEILTDNKVPNRMSSNTSCHCLCLLCYEKCETGNDFGFSKLHSNLLVENVRTIFLLKNVLNIPRTKLIEFLKTSGASPNMWFNICQECQPTITEAWKIHEEMLKLLKQLENCRDKIVGRIQDTFLKKDEVSSDSDDVITNTIRSFASAKKIAKDDFFLSGDNQAKMVLTQGECRRRRRKANKSINPLKRRVTLTNPQLSETGEPVEKIRKVKSTLNIVATTVLNCEKIKKKKKNKPKPKLRPKGSYICPICPRIQAMLPKRFVQHAIFHHDRPYKCTECNTFLPGNETFQTWETHWSQFHPESAETPRFERVLITPQIFECLHPSCSKIFSETFDRDLHMTETHTAVVPERELDCHVCKAQFVSQTELQLHFAWNHPRIAKMSCFQCLETFSCVDSAGTEVFAEKKLDDHMKRKSHSKTGYTFIRLKVCDWCGLTFNCFNTARRRRHERLFHRIESNDDPTIPTDRSLSPIDFPSSPVATPQPQVPTEEAPEEPDNKPKSKKRNCPMCPYIPEMNFEEFLSHLLFHQRKPYKCTGCSAYLSHVGDEVVKHWKRFHPGSVTELQYVHVPFEPGNVWDCFECEETFPSIEERDEHVVTHQHNHLTQEIETPRSCSSCSKSFRTSEDWRLHRVLEHPEVDQLSCLFCDKSFGVTTTTGLEIRNPNSRVERTHVNSSHNKYFRPYEFDVCELCGQVFHTGTKSVPLIAHQIKTHGIPESESFTCPVCPQNKFFKWKTPMGQHIRHIHLGKKYLCSICGWKGTHNSYLIKHEFSQHGIRPSEESGVKLKVCPHEGCSYETSEGSNFRLHVASHTNERPHICGVCGKGFKDRGHLKRHETAHANAETKPFQCEICGSSFAVRNYLYIHKRLSHQRKAFPCHFKKKIKKREKSENDVR